MGKRSVSFSEEVGKIPEDILEPYLCSFSLDEDPYCQSLGVSSLTLLRCAKLLQGFVRDNLSHWKYFNEERSRIVEQLDDIQVMKRGEMERVEDFITEMRREVEMELALEFDGEHVEEDPDLMKQVEEQKNKVKDLEADNARLKQQSEDTKRQNKTLAMETFQIYESIPQKLSDVRGYQAEEKRLQGIRDKYAHAIQTLQGMIKTVKADIADEKEDRENIENCIMIIIMNVEERTSKKKLVEKLWDMKLTLESLVEAS
ncbi:expressed unknown protein [Seminavis robusta]|uniref:Uncharacterized protein n=1 Tax=Seminavis robusta TaxID=568900 RepID=A0A9N8EA61_9STRA|nr:expressed unknown protein [Seminavis robusta]|eukprot:Sro666_g183920.1 n/a (258) ;mRNA; f:8073-8846